jgi:hypothetical protein
VCVQKKKKTKKQKKEKNKKGKKQKGKNNENFDCKLCLVERRVYGWILERAVASW